MVKRTKTAPTGELSEQEIAVIKSLLNYPSLEKVFDPNSPQNLSNTKEKIQSAVDQLERVIRRGTSDDAAKAAKAIDAYKTTLDFLNEIEKIRQAK